jgi:hypothetical protein
MTDIQRHGRWNPDAADEDQAAVARASGEKIKLVEGDNVHRIMPPAAGLDNPFLIVWKHYVDTDDNETIAFTCPRKQNGERCPQCERGQRLEAEAFGQVDERAIRRLFPTMRVFANAVDMNAPPNLREVRPVEYPKTVYKALLALFKSRRGGDFTDPDNGYEVVIQREGTGQSTRYPSVGPSLEGRCPIDDEDWLDQLRPLDKWAALPDRKTLADAIAVIDRRFPMLGAMTVQAESRPAGKLPKPAPRKRKKARRTMEQDLEEDDIIY